MPPYRKLLRLLAALAALALLLALSATVKAKPRLASAPRLSARALWTRSISPNADSSGAYIGHVKFPHTRRNVVYVVAGNNGSNCDPSNPVTRSRLYAFDAARGSLLWVRSTTGRSRCTTAGPVADPSGKWVYAPGLDGRMHKYGAANGKESRTQGWPQTITLMPDVEKMSSTATVGSGRLYVTISGFIGDQGHYEGHLVTIGLKNGHRKIFNTLCSNVHQLLAPSGKNYCRAELSGLFGRGQGVIDPSGHTVYIVSGNGPWNGRTNWGDSILKLNPAGDRLIDSYTPTNQAQLADGDLDLGSSGSALLPAVKQAGHQYHLLVQAGKGPACNNCGGVAIRLINRDNLSGRHVLGQLGGDLQDIQAPGSCEVLTAPAVWQAPTGRIWVFYANSCGVAGYRLASPSRGRFRLERRWLVHPGGTTPIIYAGVLYVAHSGEIRAYGPATGRLLLRIGGIGSLHWEYPLLADHELFMTDQRGRLHAFAVR